MQQQPAAVVVCTACKGSKVETGTYNFRQMEVVHKLRLVSPLYTLSLSEALLALLAKDLAGRRGPAKHAWVKVS